MDDDGRQLLEMTASDVSRLRQPGPGDDDEDDDEDDGGDDEDEG